MKLKWQDRLLLLLLSFGILFLIAAQIACYAATSAVVLVTAITDKTTPKITLSWDNDPAATSYTIYRKSKDATDWGNAISQLSGSVTSYTDMYVHVGDLYEYKIEKSNGGVGYICSGIEVPATEYRGKVILAIDELVYTNRDELQPELERLEQDLAGDGWKVVYAENYDPILEKYNPYFPRNNDKQNYSDISETPDPVSYNANNVRNLKQAIKNIYDSDPTNVKAVLLLGHLPIPYSGWCNPEGHGNRAFPADMYYGDIDGTWTDDTLNNRDTVDPITQEVTKAVDLSTTYFADAESSLAAVQAEDHFVSDMALSLGIYNNVSQSGVVVSAGQTTTANLTITPVSSGAVLSGDVVDDTSNVDISSAVVIARLIADKQVKAVAITDSAGHYVMPDLPAGSYDIVASKLYYSSLSVPVTISSGVPYVKDFSLPRAGCVRGYVKIGTDSGSLAKAEISIWHGEGENRKLQYAQSSGGIYKFINLDPTLTYTIQAHIGSSFSLATNVVASTLVTDLTLVLPSGTVSPALGTGTIDMPQASELQLPVLDDSVCSLSDPANGCISGIITNSSSIPIPISGVAVKTNPGNYSCVTDSNGLFIIPNVPPGTYNLTTSKDSSKQQWGTLDNYLPIHYDRLCYSPINNRNHNFIDDGRFDNNNAPSPVELQVGRVDFANLPAFANPAWTSTPKDELGLLKRYLDKDFNFRHGLISCPRKAAIYKNGDYFDCNGELRSYSTFFGDGNVIPNDNYGMGFLASEQCEGYLWASGHSTGSLYANAGGNTWALAGIDRKAIFMTVGGSYSLDWGYEENMLRAVIASGTHTLTSCWGLAPDYHFHPMGMGENIGYSIRLAQNNIGSGALYTGIREENVFASLMGDPTLRMHIVAPPASLSASSPAVDGSVTLTWQASSDTIIGYNVYRARKTSSNYGSLDFIRLNDAPVTSTSYTDTNASASTGTNVYMVRAIALEGDPDQTGSNEDSLTDDNTRNASGTYFNLSQGIFVEQAIGTLVTKVERVRFNPEGGTYTTAQNVTLMCPTEGRLIQYTTDTSEPKTWLDYSTPIPVAADMTITAKAIKTGWTDSDESSAVYEINGKVEPVQITSANGTYFGKVDINLSCLTSGASIYYRPFDGQWTLYTPGEKFHKGGTYYIFAAKAGMDNSDMQSRTYKVILPVDIDAAGTTHDGESWTTAYNSVQDAVDAAGVGDEIWVADGTYNENVYVPTELALYGGFEGNETSLEQRNWKLYPTILDGTGLSDSVVTTAVDGNVTISGFTICNGHASSVGGGINSVSTELTVTNCDITNNTANQNGGGICIPMFGKANIINSIITHNHAGINDEGLGGGIYSDLGAEHVLLLNNTIVDNHAVDGGGFYCVINYLVTLENNIIAYNTSGIGGDFGDMPTISNNCVFSNTDYNYPIGEYTVEYGVDQNPLFVDSTNSNYHLQADSPCINAGTTDNPDIPAVDMDQESRIYGGAIDIGADEYCSMADAKLSEDDANVYPGGGVVTAAFPDFFYSESDSRATGIRVNKTSHGLQAGSRVNVTGTMDTLVNGERCIDATTVTSAGTGYVEPLAMCNDALGGGDWNYDSATGAGQKGIAGVYSWNNIGLLTRVCGEVIGVDSTSFTINDGSIKPVDGDIVPLKIVAPVPLPSWLEVGSKVLVTGISSCEQQTNGDLHRLIRVADSDQIEEATAETVNFTTFTGWNTICAPLAPFNPEPSAVFSDFDMQFEATLTRRDAVNNAILTYDAFATLPTTFGNITLGDGYDFYNTDSGSVGYDGMPDGFKDSNDQMYDMCISLPGVVGQSTEGGWHTIGNPFNHDIAIGVDGQNILFTDGTTVKTWADAVAANWVIDMFYYLDGMSQTQYSTGYFFNDDDHLRAGKGYTLLTYKKNLAMIILAN